jgi:hypothetical protein
VMLLKETFLTNLKTAFDKSSGHATEVSACAALELFGALLESPKPILVKFRNAFLVVQEV